MRIPLDYYRILGVPIQATTAQLRQAYGDRSLQLPRREYSSAAIAIRKQLLEQADQVLSDPQKRAEYDTNLLEKTDQQEPAAQVTLVSKDRSETPSSESDRNQTFWLEIPPEQFVGALLILQELGEYEIVIRSGKTYLEGENRSRILSESLDQLQKGRADIILTLALAYLELSREQWQQGDYEKAAVSGEAGRDLLIQEGLFPSVRGEITSDLCKLRPYRILELLALSEDQVTRRQQGLQLLQQMLQERQGIDGKGNDQSGLSTDDFLRFIQQLRNYLTAAEQQELFEAEARRPSAVANYLAAYTLLARGFAQREPALILRARDILKRLGKRQDLNLEQAVCALLLGQPEAASLVLERSREEEPLAFIREHSQGAPDLLPGLCLYGERWLQNEVFPHFRDLASQQASLQAYFGDREVQAYLEQLPRETQLEEVAPQTRPTVTATPEKSRRQRNNQGRRQKAIAQPVKAVGVNYNYGSSPVYGQEPAVGQRQQTNSTIKTYPTAYSYQTSGGLALKDDRRMPAAQPQVTPPVRQPLPQPDRQQQESRKQELAQPLPNSPGQVDKKQKSLPQRSDKRGPKFNLPAKTRRLLALGVAMVLGVGVVALVVQGIRNSRPASSVLEGEQLLLKLSQSPIEIPPADAHLVVMDEVLTPESAKELIESWLSAKSQAFGPNHKIEQLNQILAEPLLSQQRKNAEGVKQDKAYRQYEHKITVRSLQMNPDNPERATVEAAVRETAQYYQGGQIKQDKSYDDNLVVRYDLVRQKGQWLIQGIQSRKFSQS